ncbi:uncharacterized protein CTRU02_205760 [Colletotrichum truncatum]|uniref:Uncharacterized protein n=1 Tax=Colletotrichum truncatum TaxID=5467 RepID=A0ACC3Z589_COLTU|nr:uncharacterized protein CTRU02_09509 [Colletotrichum truncatum]KAF6788701.1 hypothetical protein CTRU02_09509 [Colletotrichum truncatum]
MAFSVQHGLLALLLAWTQLVSFASATTYSYTITYGAGNYVCHARVQVYINSSNPTTAPEADLRNVYCVQASGGTGTYDVPVRGDNGAITGASTYIMNLGPATSRGDRGFEIGIDQPAITYAGNVRIPGMNPRLNLYTNARGEPLGACSYRQGAIVLAQSDGSPMEPYRSCPVGSVLAGSIGRWLICQVGCGRF